jgi:hypothetical protein
METAARQRGVFAVDENAALAELELAWADGGYHGFSVDDGTWSAISGARGGPDRRHPGLADQEDPSALAGDAVMSDLHALAAVPAEVRTCRVCRLADPPPDPTCRDGRDHRVGTAAGCPHCGRLPQACAWRPCFGSIHQAASTTAQLVRLSRLAQRLVTPPAAGRADQ